MKLLIMVVEGAILILLAFAINQSELNYMEDEISRKLIARKTAIVHMIITSCFAIAVIFK